MQRKDGHVAFLQRCMYIQDDRMPRNEPNGGKKKFTLPKGLFDGDIVMSTIL